MFRHCHQPMKEKDPWVRLGWCLKCPSPILAVHLKVIFPYFIFTQIDVFLSSLVIDVTIVFYFGKMFIILRSHLVPHFRVKGICWPSVISISISHDKPKRCRILYRITLIYWNLRGCFMIDLVIILSKYPTDFSTSFFFFFYELLNIIYYWMNMRLSFWWNNRTDIYIGQNNIANVFIIIYIYMYMNLFVELFFV